MKIIYIFILYSILCFIYSLNIEVDMKEIVKDGYCTETESVNFESKKCENTLPRNIWETYSAFANTSGGRIALGFTETEDGRLKLNGVNNPEKIVKTFWDLLHDGTKVSINLLIEDDVKVFEYCGLKYIVINVPRADRHSRPVYINNDLNNGTYRRNNEGDYHCTIPEIMEMDRDSSDITTDREPIPGTSIDDIDSKTLAKYRNHMRSIDTNHPWINESDEGFLRLLGAAEDVDGKLLLTNAGLLMFGKNHRITRMFPSFHLDYREYNGDEEWSDRFFSDSGLWSGNVFDFYLEVSNRLFVASEHPFILNGDRRKDTTEIIKAEREAVLNGLAHADYRGTCGISIEMRRDSLIVRNPGCFRIPPEKAVRGRYTDARNPVMMKMFTLVGFVERAGSGIYRILRACAEEGFDPPMITEETNPNTVTFKISFDPNCRNIEEGALALAGKEPKITIAEMASKLHVSSSTMYRIVVKLRADGRLVRIGGPRGHWEIKK